MKKQIYTPQKHHHIVRAALVIFAIFIFGFNTLVKVDVQAENGQTSINIQTLLVAHNDYRKSQGLSELSINELLNKSAQAKADAMLASNCWSHYCPNGKSPWEFFKDANYDYVFAGENLAEGFYNIEDVMKAWINSPTHKENIVKKEYTDVGFGIAYGNYQNNKDNIIVVVHFGSRMVSALTTLKNIKIVNPTNGAELKDSSTDIVGNETGFDKINIISNNTLNGQAKIDNGIFTYNLNNLSLGENQIYAQGMISATPVNSNTVTVNYKPQTSDNNFLITSSNTKNMFNLGFVVVLALMFLFDFLIVSRTQALKNFKSFSHYHFVLFLIMAMVIVVGGLAGQIGTSISI